MVSRFMITLLLLSVLGCNSSFSNKHRENLKVITYNIWNGFESDRKSQQQGIAWLKKETPDVVALQELVGVSKDTLKSWAEQWGHKYVAMLKEDGYPTALTSKWPIKNVERRLEGMAHGYLYGETAGFAFMVVHFSPFRYTKRYEEQKFVLEQLQGRVDNTITTFILGDFNAVSPKDSVQYRINQLATSFAATDKRYDHIQNLKNKAVDYSILQKFYDEGWLDLVHQVNHDQLIHTYPSRVFAPVPDNEKRRIDYILVNTSYASHIDTAYVDTSISVSDHYPVVAKF